MTTRDLLLYASGMFVGMGYINCTFDEYIVGITEIIVAFIFYLREDAKKG